MKCLLVLGPRSCQLVNVCAPRESRRLGPNWQPSVRPWRLSAYAMPSETLVVAFSPPVNWSRRHFVASSRPGYIMLQKLPVGRGLSSPGRFCTTLWRRAQHPQNSAARSGRWALTGGTGAGWHLRPRAEPAGRLDSAITENNQRQNEQRQYGTTNGNQRPTAS